MDQYQDWINKNVTETYGECHRVATEMQASFPELKLVRGHYHCWLWGERAHWWLVDWSGTIIDPTKDQFPSKGCGKYVPWVEGSPEPTGKCPNCGNLIYHGGEVCDDDCGRQYVAWVTQNSHSTEPPIDEEVWRSLQD